MTRTNLSLKEEIYIACLPPFLPAIVSISGIIRVELLRQLYLLADNKTTRFFQALGEEVDVHAEVYTLSRRRCRRETCDRYFDMR